MVCFLFLWYPSDSCCVSWGKSGFCFGSHSALHQGMPLEWGVPWNEGLPWGCLFQELPAPQAGQSWNDVLPMAFSASFEFSYIAEWRGSCGESTRPNLGWGRCQDLLSTRPVCKIHMTTWPCSKPWGEGVCWEQAIVSVKLPNQKFNLTLPPLAKFLTGTSPGTNVVHDTRHTPEYNTPEYYIQSSDSQQVYVLYILIVSLPKETCKIWSFLFWPEFVGEWGTIFAPYQPAYVGRDIKIYTESFQLRLVSIFLKSRKGWRRECKKQTKEEERTFRRCHDGP